MDELILVMALSPFLVAMIDHLLTLIFRLPTEPDPRYRKGFWVAVRHEEEARGYQAFKL